MIGLCSEVLREALYSFVIILGTAGVVGGALLFLWFLGKGIWAYLQGFFSGRKK